MAHEFILTHVDACLHIANTDLYVIFNHILGGDLKTAWATAVARLAANNRTIANFPSHVCMFLHTFLPLNTFLIQQEYLNNSIKPMFMDCYAFSSHLNLINTLSKYLPGSNTDTLFTTNTAKKNASYKLMLPDWQLKFNGTGNALDNVDYTLASLVDFIEQQHLYFNTKQDAKKKHSQSSYSPSTSYSCGGPIHPPPPPPPPPPPLP